MIERTTTYFEKPGPKNTDATIKAARKRAELLNIRRAVIATNTGETPLRCAEFFKHYGIELFAVTLAAGRWKRYVSPGNTNMERFQSMGGKVITASHLFIGNIGTAIREQFGGLHYSELIGHTFYRFSQGVKVAVEISLMASDAGLFPTNEEIIAIAGTRRGADTALVLLPAYSNEFFNLKIREIIAMPR